MFVKKINMPNPVKSLGYIKCYSSSSPRSLKRPRNSDVTVRRSAVDREDLKPYGKSEKRPHYSRWSTILLFTSFSKTLITAGRRLTGQQFLPVAPFLIFLNTGTADETF